MDMPEPTAEHKRLEKLAGIWRGTETMHPSQWDPKGSTAEAESRCRVAVGGFHVVVDYEQKRDGVVCFEGHGVYCWDAEKGEVVLEWFDSIGTGREQFRGGWKGDVLTLQSHGPMGHMRLTYDHSKPGQLGSAMDMSPDGKAWSRMFDGVYRRVD
ncbi:MAG: DUF1579 family protein [Planctomycetota bacterium]